MSPTDPASPVFTDITKQVGVYFKHDASSPEKDYIVEAKRSGAGLFDYDNDG